MHDDFTTLGSFIDAQLGDHEPIDVAPMQGGGSCEVFSVSRGIHRWVLRRAPRHASSATAHDVLREFTILDAIKDEKVAIARPIIACSDPAVFGAPFYVMQRIDGVPVRGSIPKAWVADPGSQGRALEQLIDALVDVHAVDWQRCGLGQLAHPEHYLERQVERWLSQMRSYESRPLPKADAVGAWLENHRPVDQPPALFHGDYKLDNVLFALDTPPKLLAVVDWEMASIGDPLVDLAWALIFHPRDGTMRLGTTGDASFAVDRLPSGNALIERYAAASGRDVSAIDWYHVFSRWKLAIVLEGSYAKFLRGESSKPVHEYFGRQTDLLLDSAMTLIS